MKEIAKFKTNRTETIIEIMENNPDSVFIKTTIKKQWATLVRFHLIRLKPELKK